MTSRPATYITNVHPAPRVCGVCPAPIVDGQPAYVRRDGTGASHTECPVTPSGARIARGRKESDPCQAGTPGCCIDHQPGDENSECDTW